MWPAVEEGTNVWHLATGNRMNTPVGPGERGVTTAMAWITKPDDADDGLAFGTEGGYLCVWKKAKGEANFVEIFCDLLNSSQEGREVTAIAYDTTSGQLAVIHRSEVMHRFAIDGAMQPISLKSVRMMKHWPQAVAFGQTSALGPELWTFGREDGEIRIHDQEGKMLKTRTTGTVMGHAAVNVRDDVLVVDDVAQGAALYRMSSTERVRTFEVPCDERRSRNVSFHDGGATIVIGSDHGNVYLFDRRTGDINDVLNIGAVDWVQSIACSDLGGIPVIITGRSGESTGKTELQVWEKNTVVTATSDSYGRNRRPLLEDGRWLLCVGLSVLFILENILCIPVLRWVRNTTYSYLGIPSFGAEAA
ncbi:hypothetical protein VNI00_014745 [Paramarasmius palmivorus]|uniref:Uncharacterized protein n=1 Tax=Paramarasmius palmivorus TaxID=297713 RepID=A0AAW0BQJ6_9AGAR